MLEAHDPETNYRGLPAVDSCCVLRLAGPAKTGKFADPRYAGMLVLYEELPGGAVRVPLAMGKKLWAGAPPPPVREIPRPVGLARAPRPEQEEIISRMFEHLGETGGVMLDCDPGMGKTYMSWYAALALGAPTAVVVARVDFARQWANELQAVRPGCAGEVCVLGGKQERSEVYTATPETARYLVVRAGILKDLPREVLERYGVLVLDETHMLGTQESLRGVMRFGGARYVIGCSGTPEKPDGRHAAVEMFLGRRSIVARRERAVDFAFVPLNVSVDESNYLRLLRGSGGREDAREVPPHMAEYGRMEISIAAGAATTNRLALVAYALWKMGHKVLVMSKYRRQCMGVVDVLRRWGVRAGAYVAEAGRRGERYDGMADVLVGTTQITMTAFDQATSGVAFDRRFSAAVLCQSLSQEGNLWQAVGRIMRAPPEVEPLFVMARYPRMTAYAKQHESMLRMVQERGLRVRGEDFIFPPGVHARFMGEEVVLEILRGSPPVPPPHEVYPHPEGLPLRESDTAVPGGEL